MKKLFAIALLLTCFYSAFSQIRTDSIKRISNQNPVLTTQAIIIPAGKATLIRKDMVNLKTQLIQMRDSVTVLKMEMDSQVDKMKTGLDNMSEMGEMESLRLQMAMERLSKMMSTISNILKKISETQSQITQNLK